MLLIVSWTKKALFLDQDSPLILYPIGSVLNTTNASGLKYQSMKYFDSKSGKITLSLFNNSVLILVVDNNIFKFNPED